VIYRARGHFEAKLKGYYATMKGTLK